MSVPERAKSPFPEEAYGIQRTVLRPVPSPDLDATLPIVARRSFQAQPILPMKCLGCQGPVQRAAVPVTLERNGCRLSWEAVPAWVCTRCGVSYFEQHEVQRLHDTLRAAASARR
jgi:YgiT-type zinc finger domain-containing protein